MSGFYQVISDTERSALADDLRAIALAHAALDEIGVPRTNDDGARLTLLGRIEALRAGRFDPATLSPPVPFLVAASPLPE